MGLRDLSLASCSFFFNSREKRIPYGFVAYDPPVTEAVVGAVTGDSLSRGSGLHSTPDPWLR